MWGRGVGGGEKGGGRVEGMCRLHTDSVVAQ